MKLKSIWITCSAILIVNTQLVSLVSGDVTPGDVIDKGNWENLGSLLPEPILNWVKKGDYILNVGELSYSPAEFFPPAALKSLEANVGKYDLDKNDAIIEATTGRLPSFIEGIPFPKIEPNDPKAGQKLLYNKNYNVYCMGGLRYPFQVVWVGRQGYEREVGCEYLQLPLDGYPAAKEMQNAENIERYLIISVWKPFDLAGTAVMLWRYRGVQQDLNFSYVPAIRRIRRMSPANRSDAFVGSDGTIDDAMGYDGKIPAFSWQTVAKQEALLPFLSAHPERLIRTEEGSWGTTKEITSIVYGHQQQGWKGAPWSPTNLTWVKRPTWIIKAEPKDSYYNYGTQYLWIDAENFYPIYKLINDRSGKYWKNMMIATAGMESEDKTVRLSMVALQQNTDERTDHSTYVENMSPKNKWLFFADVDANDFTLSGFQKYCK